MLVLKKEKREARKAGDYEKLQDQTKLVEACKAKIEGFNDKTDLLSKLQRTVSAADTDIKHINGLADRFNATSDIKAKANVLLNGFDLSRTTFMDADVNASLRAFAAEGRTFDAIILDPPKFAPTVAHAERAARAYKDINRLAFKLLEPGGVLFTYSCSGGISADLFHKIIAGAGSDAGVDGFITDRMGGAPDHPMTIAFPEGEYLKGLVVMRR